MKKPELYRVKTECVRCTGCYYHTRFCDGQCSDKDWCRANIIVDHPTLLKIKAKEMSEMDNLIEEAIKLNERIRKQKNKINELERIQPIK